MKGLVYIREMQTGVYSLPYVVLCRGNVRTMLMQTEPKLDAD